MARLRPIDYCGSGEPIYADPPVPALWEVKEAIAEFMQNHGRSFPLNRAERELIRFRLEQKMIERQERELEDL